MDKHPATPAAVLPARQLVADQLLQIDDAKSTLKKCELSLKGDPNRFRCVLGSRGSPKGPAMWRGTGGLSKAAGVGH